MFTSTCASSVLECAVPLLQVVGASGLCLSRLLPGTKWSRWGRIVLVGALVCLGLVGTVLGAQDSPFGLFAGGSVAALVIGVTMGSGPHSETIGHLQPEPHLVS